MKWKSTLLVVTDLAQAKAFYCDFLGLAVTADFGANITLENAISLQTLPSWCALTDCSRADIALGGNDAELYLETDDIDALFRQLELHPEIRLLHPPKTHPWGQRVVRLRDSDGHIVEIGEPLDCVAQRFADAGMTPAEIARRMDLTEEFVRSLLKNAAEK